MKLRRIACALLLAWAATPALAAERMYICARTETFSGWSKPYLVPGVSIMGNELNQATNSFRYNAFSYYAVLFWNPGETVIRVNAIGGVGPLDTEGVDQEGRHWRLHESSENGPCF